MGEGGGKKRDWRGVFLFWGYGGAVPSPSLVPLYTPHLPSPVSSVLCAEGPHGPVTGTTGEGSCPGSPGHQSISSCSNVGPPPTHTSLIPIPGGRGFPLASSNPQTCGVPRPGRPGVEA